jgi:cytolysin-activating lysine-acyltransferase
MDGNAAAFSTPETGAPRTIAEALGQITWLLSQSPMHRELKIKDLEWSIMPAILKEQFRLFRFGPTTAFEGVDPMQFAALGLSREGLEQLPLGLAIWAHLSDAAEAKLEQGERLSLEDWNSGDKTWLVELITPFATEENKLSEVMLVDLLQGPFRDRPVHLHRTDPRTGRRDKITIASHLSR